MKGIQSFSLKRKLSLGYVGPFQIFERIGATAYRLVLHNRLEHIHDVFYVSSLRQCLMDESQMIDIDLYKLMKT